MRLVVYRLLNSPHVLTVHGKVRSERMFSRGIDSLSSVNTLREYFYFPQNRMKSLLLVQFRTDVSFIHERVCYYTKVLRHNVRIKAINALDSNIDWCQPKTLLGDHSGIILGGSGEFYISGNKTPERHRQFKTMERHIQPFLSHVIQNNIPTLGICFGHQFLGHVLGTKIFPDPLQAKVGTFCVRLTKEGRGDPIFSGMPKSFPAQYTHKDSLSSLPKNSTLLACGDRCSFSAFRHNSHIYGVQFHPEMSCADMRFRLRLYTEYIKKPLEEALKDYTDSADSERILSNFISFVI